MNIKKNSVWNKINAVNLFKTAGQNLQACVIRPNKADRQTSK